MKRSWETLVICARAACVAVKVSLCMLRPPSCSCTEQLVGRKAALQLHCSTLGPHCHISTRSSVMELGLVILIIQPINWAWLSRFLIVTWLLARCCCTQWSHVRIKRQLGPFSVLFFFLGLIKYSDFFPPTFDLSFQNFCWNEQCDLRRGFSLSYSLMLHLAEIFFFFFWNICLKCLVLFRGTISRIMHARQHEGFKSRTFVTSANGVWLREEFDLGVLVLYLSVLLLSISFASA